jgi:multiple antibiotic resistance protein
MSIDAFWHAFIPLFVAFDGVGLLPLFWGLAHKLSPAVRRKAVTEAIVTAYLVAIVFLLVSRFLLAMMGLELADVMMAGGAILVVLSLRDILFAQAPPEGHYPNPGVVPLGVPLLAGPAALTTLLLVRDRHGWIMAVISLVVNLAVVWVILASSERLMRRLGEEGAEVVSKVASLILTAFGIMLIRQGVAMLFGVGLQGPPS